MTSGEKLMAAIREFNEEMGRQSAEQSVRFNAMLESVEGPCSTCGHQVHKAHHCGVCTCGCAADWQDR